MSSKQAVFTTYRNVLQSVSRTTRITRTTRTTRTAYKLLDPDARGKKEEMGEK